MKSYNTEFLTKTKESSSSDEDSNAAVAVEAEARAPAGAAVVVDNDLTWDNYMYENEGQFEISSANIERNLYIVVYENS